jgi:hypothetical protein
VAAVLPEVGLEEVEVEAGDKKRLKDSRVQGLNYLISFVKDITYQAMSGK